MSISDPGSEFFQPRNPDQGLKKHTATLVEFSYINCFLMFEIFQIFPPSVF